MSTNYSPKLVTDGAVFVGDARSPSAATAGSRLYDQAGINSADVKLLIHGNEGSGQSFTDSSLSNHTVTANGDVTHSTTQSKFSGGSIKFDGTGDYLRTSPEDFLDGNWTVDCWFYYDASFPGTIEGLIALDYDGASGSSNNALNFGVTSGAMALLVSSNVSSGWNIVNTTGGTVAANAWNHGAVVFDGSTYKAYLNGSQVISVTSSTAVASQSSSQIIVGTTADGSSGQSWNGYIDEVRVTQAALWTNTFTPPARRDTLSISDGMMHNGSCVDFDGTDASVNYGDVTWLDGLTVVSVSCWFYLDGTPPNAAAMLVSKDNTLECAVRRDSTTEYSLSINNDHVKFTSATAVATGEWIHVVYTWNSTGDVRKLYVNGTLEETNTTGNESGLALLNSSAILAIGDRPSHSYEIDGRMSDVKIFSEELSVDQVKEMYEDSKVIVPSSASQTALVFWAPLTEGAGTIAYDGSGNGKSGTYTGTSFLTGQTGCPQLVEGYNRPTLFPGATSDYVAVGNSSSFCFGTSNFSFGAWVNTSDSAFQMVFDAIDPIYKGWQLAISNLTPKMRLWVSTGSAQVNLDASVNVCDGNWHHVGFTVGVASPQEVTLYADGISVASYNGWSNLNMVGGTYASWIGGQSAGPNYPFKGLINEVVLYDALLSSAQMVALAATGPPRNINLLTGDNASFHSGVGSWTASGGSIAASGGQLVITGNGSSAGVNVLQDLSGFTVGRSYIFSGYIKRGTSSNTGGHIQVYDTGGSGVDASTAFSLTTQFVKYSIEFVATATTLRLYLYKSGTDSATYIADNLEVYAVAGDPLPPDPMSLSNSSDVVAYWRNDDNVTWKNRGPQTIKNFTDVATDPINDSNSVGSWTNNGTSLTSVLGGRTGFIEGAMRVAPRYRFLFNSAINCTVNSIRPVTSGKAYKISAWFRGGTSTTGRLIVTGGYYDSGNFTAASTVWTNKTATFTATSTGNVTIELHNRAAGTIYFDDVTLVESGPALDGTVNGSPDSLLFKQGINGSGSTSTGRDGQGFPLKYKDVGAIGFDGSSTYIEVAAPGGGALDITTNITLASWCFAASKSNWKRVIARRATASSALPYMLGLDDSTDQKWNFYIDGSSGATSFNSSGPASTNTWVYVVGVLRGTSMEIYLNGVLDNSITHSGGLDAGATDPNVQIGSQLMPANTSYVWDGQIANAQIYNRGLSSAEILQNYNVQRSRFE